MTESTEAPSEPSADEALRDAWAGAERMRARMQAHVIGAFARIPQVGLAHAIYNLPLLLACDVLRQALAHQKRQRLFKAKGNSLGQLMESARDALQWIDYEGMRQVVVRRNAIAHDGLLFEAEVCLADIARIEAQLRAWGILNSDAATL